MPTADIKQVVFKTEEDGSGFITGYASTFDNWDSVNERPVRGAFAPHLESFLKSGFVAIAHNWSALEIGMPVDAYEDDHGLFVRAEFHDTPDAQSARSVVKKRLAKNKDVSLSIGYEVLRDEYTQEGRLLKDVKLYEWSIVTVPANTRALVTDAKENPRMSLESEAKAALTAARRFLARVAAIADLREASKESRVLSAVSIRHVETALQALDALEDARKALQALLESAQPKDNPDKALALFAQFQSIEARINGALPL